MSIVELSSNEIQLKVRVKTKSSNFKIQYHEDIILIYLTSSPVKGKANKELVNNICKLLKINTSKLKLVKGANSPLKIIKISGLDLNYVKNAFKRD